MRLAPSATEERPLHVRVAEALGCSPVWFDRYGNGTRVKNPWWACGCPDKIHNEPGIDNAPHEGSAIEAYDTDWSATGRLIEKYGVRLNASAERGHSDWWHACLEGRESCDYGSCGESADAETPLEAVCRLILALKQAGKL